MGFLKAFYLSLPLAFFVSFFSFARPYQAKRENVNIRFDSTTFADIIGNLQEAEKVEVIREKYGWYQIKLPSRLNCWAWAEFIKPSEKNQGLTTAANVNIRSQPSRKGEILGRLNKGDKVSLRGKKENWAKISCYPYAKGWVHSRLLVKTEKEECFHSLIKDKITKLSSASQKKVEKIQKEISAGGQKAFFLIEKKLPGLDEKTVYRVIKASSQICEKNPQLIGEIFSRINPENLPESAFYLDVLANVILKSSPKIPFYYLVQQNELTQNNIESAAAFLKKKNQK